MPPKKRGNGHKLPEPLPLGEVLEDGSKKKWKLGNTIGKGGFGEIYSAQEYNEKENNSEYPYVVKIEPHENGPLFVEMNFLLRNAKKEDVMEFMKQKKLKSLGMPTYISSGSHTVNEEKYRFIVLERFGEDVSKLFLDCKKEFPIVTVFKVASQIVDVLEYIHSKGYVHHDIKGANVLLDLKSKNQVYLLDYGLAGRYFTGNEFKREPKKAHDGTLEYISRDGHNGVQTRRGDLEILGYNIIQWLGCSLPWEKIKSPPTVQKSKEKYMNDIPDLMKACFKEKDPPKAVMEYFIYLNNLNFDSEPDYNKLKKILTNGIDSNGGTIKSPLVFTQSKTPIKRKGNTETPSSGKKPRLPRRKLNVNNDDIEQDGQEAEEEEVKVDDKKKNKKKVAKNEAENIEKPKKKVRGKNNDDEDVENEIKVEKPKKKIRGKTNDEKNGDGEIENELKVEKPKKKGGKTTHEDIEDDKVEKTRKRVRQNGDVKNEEVNIEKDKKKGRGKKDIEKTVKTENEPEDANEDVEPTTSKRYPKRTRK